MSEEFKPKPCPFCGEDKVSVQDLEFTDQIECDNCGYITSPVRWNDRPIEDALRLRITELEENLNEWYMAWITDCISPTSNGVTSQGMDEGIVLSVRMMRPILDKTRALLNKSEVN